MLCNRQIEAIHRSAIVLIVGRPPRRAAAGFRNASRNETRAAPRRGCHPLSPHRTVIYLVNFFLIRLALVIGQEVKNRDVLTANKRPKTVVRRKRFHA